MTESVIRASKVTLRRKHVDVLQNISFDLPAGAVLGLVGRNGAGKSSLLQCLAGLAAPDAGSCELLGCPSLDLSDAVRERLGYVAQTPDLFGWMSVVEHLQTIGRAYPRWDEERCLTLALRQDLPLATRVRDLSGGDQQKLSVVLALAHDPDVLLFDEPVASLDPLSRREFMRAIFSERAEDRERTVIISSHILSDLERVATHIAFIRHGRLQLLDSWDAMLEHYRLAPHGSAAPANAVVWRGQASGMALIDTRRAPDLAGASRPLTLDELFMELNT
ncbi:ABC transporter ATP-binding protein [Pseudoduganella sp. LjRoot289]|uniref:ABC transporter ATP-binding protein n=1 Tax=Pseudoduganella sp. LjRoot289 TaxID=3342314 RepID=UPI003ECE09CA